MRKNLEQNVIARLALTCQLIPFNYIECCYYYGRWCHGFAKRSFARPYDPAMNGVDWEQIADSHRTRILDAETREEFEAQMNEMIRELRVSHSGFFSGSSLRASAKIAIGATFFAEGNRWIFQDVHAGGPAH